MNLHQRDLNMLINSLHRDAPTVFQHIALIQSSVTVPLRILSVRFTGRTEASNKILRGMIAGIQWLNLIEHEGDYLRARRPLANVFVEMIEEDSRFIPQSYKDDVRRDIERFFPDNRMSVAIVMYLQRVCNRVILESREMESLTVPAEGRNRRPPDASPQGRGAQPERRRNNELQDEEEDAVRRQRLRHQELDEIIRRRLEQAERVAMDYHRRIIRNADRLMDAMSHTLYPERLVIRLALQSGRHRIALGRDRNVNRVRRGDLMNLTMDDIQPPIQYLQTRGGRNTSLPDLQLPQLLILFREEMPRILMQNDFTRQDFVDISHHFRREGSSFFSWFGRIDPQTQPRANRACIDAEEAIIRNFENPPNAIDPNHFIEEAIEGIRREFGERGANMEELEFNGQRFIRRMRGGGKELSLEKELVREAVALAKKKKIVGRGLLSKIKNVAKSVGSFIANNAKKALPIAKDIGLAGFQAIQNANRAEARKRGIPTRNLLRGELHIANHNYSGPNTVINEETLKAPPIDAIDAVSREHDIAYALAKKISDPVKRAEAIHKADEIAIKGYLKHPNSPYQREALLAIGGKFTLEKALSLLKGIPSVVYG